MRWPATARARGCRYFVYLNADIEVTGDAVARVRDGGSTATPSRGSTWTRSRADPQVQRFGVDMFAIDAGWWSASPAAVPPYIAGEACWDNVYAAVAVRARPRDIVDEAPDRPRAPRHPLGRRLFAPTTAISRARCGYLTQWVTFIARREAARRSRAAS